MMMILMVTRIYEGIFKNDEKKPMMIVLVMMMVITMDWL